MIQLRILPASHHKLKAPLWVDADIDLAKLPLLEPPNQHFPAQPQTAPGEEPAGPDGNIADGNSADSNRADGIGADGKSTDGNNPDGNSPAAALRLVESILVRAVPPPAATVRYTAYSLPHRAVLERLPANLTCHLRSGVVAKAGAAGVPDWNSTGGPKYPRRPEIARMARNGPACPK